eukprot:s2550_g8.t1
MKLKGTVEELKTKMAHLAEENLRLRNELFKRDDGNRTPRTPDTQTAMLQMMQQQLQQQQQLIQLLGSSHASLAAAAGVVTTPRGTQAAPAPVPLQTMAMPAMAAPAVVVRPPEAMQARNASRCAFAVSTEILRENRPELRLVVLQSAVTGEEYLRLPFSELGTGQQIKRILARFLGHPTFAISIFADGAEVPAESTWGSLGFPSILQVILKQKTATHTSALVHFILVGDVGGAKAALEAGQDPDSFAILGIEALVHRSVSKLL